MFQVIDGDLGPVHVPVGCQNHMSVALAPSIQQFCELVELCSQLLGLGWVKFLFLSRVGDLHANPRAERSDAVSATAIPVLDAGAWTGFSCLHDISRRCVA